MTLEPVFVEFIPEELEFGKLYISKEYGTAIHLCACGKCGFKTVTPLAPFWPRGWSYKEVDGKVTLGPSIGNWQFPCRSHYFIEDNQVRFC